MDSAIQKKTNPKAVYNGSKRRSAPSASSWRAGWKKFCDRTRFWTRHCSRNIKKYWKSSLFWFGAGIVGMASGLLLASGEGSRIPFTILISLLLSFLMVCGRFKFEEAMRNLVLCVVGQILAGLLMDVSSMITLVFCGPIVLLVSYPCWFWLTRCDWEASAGRWGLYFVLLLLGLLAVPERRLVFILLLIVLRTGVHLFCTGGMRPIRFRRPVRSAERVHAPKSKHRNRANAGLEHTSLQSVMLERARRKAMKDRARRLAGLSDLQENRTGEKKAVRNKTAVR